MRDPLDFLARYFFVIIAGWGAMMALAFAWVGFRIAAARRAKRRKAAQSSR